VGAATQGRAARLGVEAIPQGPSTRPRLRLGRKEKDAVRISRVRALVLGLLAVMLAGSVMAATASAEAGPFWHHRAFQGTGAGLKIEPKAPENFSGEGGEQILKGLIGITEFEIVSKSLQVKGAIFNNPNQGQIKLEIVYNQPKLLRPEISGCVVTVGAKNIVQVKGHLMWKWNGTTQQLNEQPQRQQKWDIGFTAIEPQQQESAETQILKEGTFTTITFTSCGVLNGTFNVSGSEVGIPDPSQLEEWSRNLTVRTVDHKQGTGHVLQHYWAGTRFQGAELGLRVGTNSATLTGQTKVSSEQQEISVFEK